MTLPISTYGDPALRKKSVEVVEINDDIRALADEMLRTMYHEHGLGLAAEQVGRSEAICVIDIPPSLDVDEETTERDNPEIEMPLVLINPMIVGHGEEIMIGVEGCLSFPDIFANVERWHEVEVRFTNEKGEAKALKVRGLLSRAVQHELDHLQGVLLVDRMSHVKRVALSGKLKRLAKKTKMVL
jgi:peptide deformylase